MSKHVSMLALALLAIGCDEAKQAEADSSASLQANTTIVAKDFELATVVELVEREDVRDAESLEALINAEDSTIHVDVDGDGTRDFIQVHEVGEAGLVGSAKVDVEVQAEAEADGALRVAGKDGEAVQFELRVVPSSKVVLQVDPVDPVEVETVVVATVKVELDEPEHRVIVEARYAPTVVVVSHDADVEVEHVYVHHVELEHRHDHWVVVGSPFVAWVWFDARPHYYGHVHLPPGQAKKMGLYWHGGHHGGGHGKGHWKGGGHGGGHGGGGHHGGPDKVHVKVKGGPGPGGGGKVHVKAKGGKGKH